jgi:hypothetical protein
MLPSFGGRDPLREASNYELERSTARGASADQQSSRNQEGDSDPDRHVVGRSIEHTDVWVARESRFVQQDTKREHRDPTYAGKCSRDDQR